MMLLYECRIDCLPELTGGSQDQIQAAEMPIMTLRKLHQKGKGGGISKAPQPTCRPHRYLTHRRQVTSHPYEALVSMPSDELPFCQP